MSTLIFSALSCESPASAALTLAVVGHTNTGKTSLLRTLTRDTEFGQVSNSPGTTRHVEGARLTVDGEALVELFDTPGMLWPKITVPESGFKLAASGAIGRNAFVEEEVAVAAPVEPVPG